MARGGHSARLGHKNSRGLSEYGRQRQRAATLCQRQLWDRFKDNQLWEYVVHSTRYDAAFDSQVKLAAKTWVETQLEKWSKKEVVNRSFVNLYFRSGELAGSCNLGEKYDAFAQERSEKDFVRNSSLAKKNGKPSKFIDSLAASFPFRNALTTSAGIFVRKVLQNEIVQKGIIPAKFHGRAGTISENAFPGQLVL
jgi:hypothetical protein